MKQKIYTTFKASINGYILRDPKEYWAVVNILTWLKDIDNNDRDITEKIIIIVRIMLEIKSGRDFDHWLRAIEFTKVLEGVNDNENH